MLDICLCVLLISISFLLVSLGVCLLTNLNFVRIMSSDFKSIISSAARLMNKSESVMVKLMEHAEKDIDEDYE